MTTRHTLASILILIAVPAAHAASYSLTDLGPAGISGEIRGLNNAGHLILNVIPASGISQPFLYRDGTLTNLAPAIGGSNIFLYALNNNDVITGTLANNSSFIYYPDNFKTTFQKNPALATLVRPDLLNDLNTVVAQYSALAVVDGQNVLVNTTVRWSDPNADRTPQFAEYAALQPLTPNTHTAPGGVNNAGTVAGWVAADGAGTHAARWVDNSPQLLDVHPTRQSYATAINDAGLIVGEYGDAGVGLNPFLWSPDTGTTYLPATGLATDINNSNQVIGGWNNGDAPGWLWSPSTGTQMLQDLIPPSPGWSLLSPSYINDKGQIAGIGLLNGVRQAYLLTPVPEPASLLLAICLALPLLTRRRYPPA